MPSDLYTQLTLLPAEFPEMEYIPSPIVLLMGCGSFEQFCNTLRGLIDSEFCAFCPRDRARVGRKTIAEDSGWLLVANNFPKAKTSQMWLIIPERHIVDPLELTDTDAAAVQRLFRTCITENNILGGALLMRFGDPHLHAGTMEHLHYNVIEPICGTEYRMPLAKTLAKHEENYHDLRRHVDRLASQGGEEWLIPEETFP